MFEYQQYTSSHPIHLQRAAQCMIPAQSRRIASIRPAGRDREKLPSSQRADNGRVGPRLHGPAATGTRGKRNRCVKKSRFDLDRPTDGEGKHT
jgi:hypothetical protein